MWIELDHEPTGGGNSVAVAERRSSEASTRAVFKVCQVGARKRFSIETGAPGSARLRRNGWWQSRQFDSANSGQGFARVFPALTRELSGVTRDSSRSRAAAAAA